MTAETLIADNDVKPNDETYGRRDMRFVFIFNGLLPLLIYSIAVKYTSEVNAMVLHSIPPILKGVYEISSQGQADFLSSLQVISTIVCIVLMEIFEDPKVILLKDSILLLCIAFGYFVAFYNDEWNLLWRVYRLLSETSIEEKHALDLKWTRPHIRRRFKLLAGLWGTILVLENSAKVALILMYPVGTMIFVLPLMGMVFGGSLTFGTYCYLKMKDREDSLRPETTPLV